MNPGLLVLLLVASFAISMCLGLPLVFCLGGTAMIFLCFLLGPRNAMVVISLNVSGALTDFILVAIPLFIFMASMLECSGIADALYEMMQRWMGGLNGGLLMGTIIISTIMASMVGTSSAAIGTMGVVGLPSMLKRGYDKRMTMGAIMAGGCLGILIPPSVIMMLYAQRAGVSVGRLFLGGVLPGILLAALFILYTGIRCARQPNLGPGLSINQRATWRAKLDSLKAVLLPVLVVVAVLGSIFRGMATPTEASGVGALFCIVCAAIYRGLTWKNFKRAVLNTFNISCMMLWILVAAQCFLVADSYIGSSQVIASFFTSLKGNRWLTLIGIQFFFFLVGFFLDPESMVITTAPIYVPAVTILGFDPIWFGLLFIMNMEMAYLTPPFGINLFYMRQIAPAGTTMTDIYRSVMPFVFLQMLGLAIVMIFPAIALWLPNMVYG